MPTLLLRTNRVILVLCFCAMSFMSCVVYPSLCDVPLIEEKNDAVVTAGLVLPVIGANASFAYGLTKNIAIQSHGFVDVNGDILVQQACGLYKKYTNEWVFETYGGAALGFGQEPSFLYESPRHGSYAMYYLQANFGRKSYIQPHTDFGFSLKCGLIHSNVTTYYNSSMYYEYVTDTTIYHQNSFYLSPMVFVRFGEGKFKFNLHAQNQLVLNSDINSGITTMPLSVGLSIQYRPNRINGENGITKANKPKLQSNISLSLGYNLTQYYDHFMNIDHSENSIHPTTRIISLRCDYKLQDWISLGFGGMTQNFGGRITDNYDTYDYTMNYSNINARALIHFLKKDNIDLFTGVCVGKNYYSGMLTNIKGNETYDHVFMFEYAPKYLIQFVAIGFRQDFSNYLGYNAELFIGRVAFASLGLHLKF